MRLSLIEVASQTNMSIGKGEKRLSLCQGVEMESHLADAPLFDREGYLFTHRPPPNPVQSSRQRS